MILNVPAPVPPRDLEEAVLTHGGLLLKLAVMRQAGKYLYKHTTTYVVEKCSDRFVRLIKEDGEFYAVTADGCTCKDAHVKGRERSCKHHTGCVKVGLIAGPKEIGQ